MIVGLTQPSIADVARQYAELEKHARRVRLYVSAGAVVGLGAAAIVIASQWNKPVDEVKPREAFADAGLSDPEIDALYKKAWVEHFKRKRTFSSIVYDGAMEGVRGAFYAFVGCLVYMMMTKGYSFFADNFLHYFLNDRQQCFIALQQRYIVLSDRCAEQLSLIAAGHAVPAAAESDVLDLIDTVSDMIAVLGELIGFSQYYLQICESAWGQFDAMLYTQALADQVACLIQRCQQLAEWKAVDSQDQALAPVQEAHACSAALHELKRKVKRGVIACGKKLYEKS